MSELSLTERLIALEGLLQEERDVKKENILHCLQKRQSKSCIQVSRILERLTGFDDFTKSLERNIFKHWLNEDKYDKGFGIMWKKLKKELHISWELSQYCLKNFAFAIQTINSLHPNLYHEIQETDASLCSLIETG